MKTVNKSILVVLFLFTNAVIFAQGGDAIASPGGDAGTAPTPINDYLIPMLVLGVAFGFQLVTKTSKGKNTSVKISN